MKPFFSVDRLSRNYVGRFPALSQDRRSGIVRVCRNRPFLGLGGGPPCSPAVFHNPCRPCGNAICRKTERTAPLHRTRSSARGSRVCYPATAAISVGNSTMFSTLLRL